MLSKKIMRGLDMAKVVSSWSKDPTRKVGAVIVGHKDQIISQGYNGFPRGFNDTVAALNDKNVKRTVTIHAEMNAIFNACTNGVSIEGTTMVVYGMPVCLDCAKAMIQVGIKEVVVVYTKEPSEFWTQNIRFAKTFLEAAGIKYTMVLEQ